MKEGVLGYKIETGNLLEGSSSSNNNSKRRVVCQSDPSAWENQNQRSFFLLYVFLRATDHVEAESPAGARLEKDCLSEGPNTRKRQASLLGFLQKNS